MPRSRLRSDIGQPPGKHAPGPEAVVVLPQEVSGAVWLPLDRGQHRAERRGGLEGGASLGDFRVDRRLGDLTTTGIAEPGVNPAGEIPDPASCHRPNHDDRREIDRSPFRCCRLSPAFPAPATRSCPEAAGRPRTRFPAFDCYSAGRRAASECTPYRGRACEPSVGIDRGP